MKNTLQNYDIYFNLQLLRVLPLYFLTLLKEIVIPIKFYWE